MEKGEKFSLEDIESSASQDDAGAEALESTEFAQGKQNKAEVMKGEVEAADKAAAENVTYETLLKQADEYINESADQYSEGLKKESKSAAEKAGDIMSSEAKKVIETNADLLMTLDLQKGLELDASGFAEETALKVLNELGLTDEKQISPALREKVKDEAIKALTQALDQKIVDIGNEIQEQEASMSDLESEDEIIKTEKTLKKRKQVLESLMDTLSALESESDATAATV